MQMRRINFTDEDIKECKIALVNQNLTSLQSAFLIQYINNLEDELEWYKQECDDLEMRIGLDE